MEAEQLEAGPAASAVVDTCRHLLSVLGALLGSPVGQAAAQDSSEARSLPALAKALRRLWFGTPLSEELWDSKEQVVWMCRLLCVTEGSRSGLLSFYGGAVLMIDALAVFAEYALQELGLPLDEAWAASAYTVQDVLRGPHWERFQQWPADRRCGGGSGPPLLSADRLPCTMRRVFDLEGVRLTKAQAAGLGVAMMMPGSTMIAMSSVGAALLVKKAQEHKSLLAAGAGAGASARWQVVQAGCLDHAHELLRRKTRPIEVLYQAGPDAEPQIKVSLYSLRDVFFAVPVGAVGGLGGGTGGEGVSRLAPGESCALRPQGSADTFRMRVYKPAPLLDIVLHDGVEVTRGDRVLLVAEPGRVRAYAQAVQRRDVAGTGETVVASPVACDRGGSASAGSQEPPFLDLSRATGAEGHAAPVGSSSSCAAPE